MTENDSPASIQRIRIRIESLSDLVFGLALSIGSLVLIGKVPQDGQDLAVNILLFGFGFLVVVMIWLGYSRTMAVLPGEAPSALYFNLVLLFCVALAPYLFYVLSSSPTEDVLNAGSIAYGLDVGFMFLLLAGLARLVVKGEEKARLGGHSSVHPVVVKRFRALMKAEIASGLIFVASALPVFWVNTPVGFLRFALWYSAFVFFGFTRLYGRSEQANRKELR
ncbi:MAG TPA: TMEM175 family protein [Nitrososphaerales archaeon]|nr:TMEM175 family protein [Nitrososphaerales archaeon]